MARIALSELRSMAEIYLSEWSVMTVKDEALTATGPDGTSWVSFWDNMLTAEQANQNGIDPIITVNGYALTKDTRYTIDQYGDATRTQITLSDPVGGDAVVLATFRRNMFSKAFWANNIRLAMQHTYRKLLKTTVPSQDLSMDEAKDPWHIVIMQAGKNGLINLQATLSGYGRTTIDAITTDFTRAGWKLPDVIKSLDGDIDRAVVAWRWQNSPLPVIAREALRLSGPGPLWGLY